jgi:hypothetical protein
MGTVITLVLAAACACCALLALSGFVRMARVRRAWREAAFWTAPLVFVSAAFALLTALGVLGLISGIVLSAIPLAVVTARAARAHREIAKLHGAPAATATVLGLLGARLRDALWNAREDVRELAGMLHRETPPAAAGAPAASPPSLVALRAVPSVRENPNLGPAPGPAEVAAGLEAAGTVVPPEWQAVAGRAGDFDPEDQDDLEGHMAGEAAGLLAFAEAKDAQAQTLLEGRKLHPRYVAALLEVADGAAELAALSALANRQYHESYGDVEDWHAEGNELPEDARNWGFGGGA